MAGRVRARVAVACVGAFFVLATGCHATRLAAVWHDPTAQPMSLKRTVTVFVTTDETMRRTIEDRVASKFPNATPGYRIIPSATGVDQATIVRQLRDAGFDSAIIMRLVSVDDKMAYTPGAYWYSTPYTFGGYWSMAWQYPYDPGYVAVSRIYSVETEIYSVQNEKLIFGARSETTDPQSAPKLVDSVMRHVMDELRKHQLIA